MKFFLLVLSAICFGLALLTFLGIASDVKRATWMTEVELLTLLLLSGMFFCASAVVGAVDKLRPPEPLGETPEDARERQAREVAARLIPAPPAS